MPPPGDVAVLIGTVTTVQWPTAQAAAWPPGDKVGLEK